MQCLRCDGMVFMEAAELPSNQIQPGLEGIHCPACGICVGLNHAGVWMSVQDCLLDSTKHDGWSPAQCLRDSAVHWALAQVMYRFCEPPDAEQNEALFDVPDPSDLVYLLWVGGHAVGFCTIKPEGALIESTYECYAMLTVDTVYIRSSHRRQGHVSTLLQAFANTYPNVGFSQPISKSMLKVLAKFLLNNPQCQRCFWEVTGAGNEGCRKLLWFLLCKTLV